MVKTFFAPAERAKEAELQQEILFASHNPVINGVMSSVGGLLAVLNEQRQVLAVNDDFLLQLGIDDPTSVHGLRPGEIIGCTHAHEDPHGCGTTKACVTCGAVIAIVASMEKDAPVERSCAVTTTAGGVESDVFLDVRSSPITLEGRRFLLLFMRDTTTEQRLASLERTFFHDINNLLSGLMGMSELLVLQRDGTGDLPEQIHQLTVRLAKEVAIQRLLARNDPGSLKVDLQEVTLEDILAELREFFSHHGSARNKTLLLPGTVPSLKLETDSSLVIRVLNNMLVNAFEASEEGDTVTLGTEKREGWIVFSVHNGTAIPDRIAGRIFQRHFSTKKGGGRGFGTYSLKLIGEEVLGGRVEFSTSETDGTIFRFALPL